ncbi:anthranilate synthase component I family protein [Nocardioides bruguierae]|uniref:Anthranilate synthase component I family protein n=1 Tax=Nocardioides bruguierae TaxID=2945102 RepID=A0A9X2D910_9ACTN|nr:anthranilate synthase component I family protein [Nocardioides bruguierae]MCM0620279.1 anthranilate synthase component I family protein [Nocardioides bruguierae]
MSTAPEPRDLAAERFAEVARATDRCVWLDGVGAREWSGRDSVLAWCEPEDVSFSYDATRREVTRHAGGRARVVGDDPFAVLRAELAAAPGARWYGYLGYAARPDLPAHPDPDLPDAVWLRPSRVERLPAGRPPAPRGHAAAAENGAEQDGAEQDGDDGTPPSSYLAQFAQVQEALHAGLSYEVNLTRRERVEAAADPVEVYLALRAANPAPYAGYLAHDVPGARAWLLSSSPERYARVADGTIEARPIKGTTPRGATPAQDAAAADALRHDPRYRAENLMITDLLRHDVAGVSAPGSVTVPELMTVESYPSVHQLVSTVRGRLRPGTDALAAVHALFPAGSMTGAPKLRTMDVIAAVEDSPRGVYAGAFGWLDAAGADLGVVIRSLVTAGEGTWTLGTGGGVTVHSDADSEHAETQWKAERLRAVLAAVARRPGEAGP